MNHYDLIMVHEFRSDARDDTACFPRQINNGRAYTSYEARAFTFIKRYFTHLNQSDDVKKIYAYTQTITSTYNHYKRHTEQYRNTITDITGLLSKSTEFIIIPEFTTEQRIHYHGIIGIKDNIKWGKSTFPSLQHRGFIALRKIHDIDAWINYLIKELWDTARLVGELVPITTDYEPPMVKKKSTYKTECDNALSKLLQHPSGEEDPNPNGPGPIGPAEGGVTEDSDN